MTEEELQLVALAVYAGFFAAFTFFVGAALRSRGWLFLSSAFEHRPAVASSVQFLLNLGFYLTCLGLLLWNLGTDPSTRWVDGKQVFTLRDVVQSVSTRLGVSIIVVAALHTVNILVLSILNQKSRPEKSGGNDVRGSAIGVLCRRATAGVHTIAVERDASGTPLAVNVMPGKKP